MTKEELNELSRVVVDAAFEVHCTLGPGLLESVYERALAFELRLRGLDVQVQVDLPVFYKGVDLELDFRVDLLVQNELVIELKSIKEIQDVHFKQTLTYLRLADKRLGLLINFNVPLFRDGVKRVANHLERLRVFARKSLMTSQPFDAQGAVSHFQERLTAVKTQMARTLVGQEAIVEGVLMCLMAGGHVLLEGVPGLGKTLLVRALAGSLGLDFSRIQFTPDLMPADVTGTTIIAENEAGKREFQFQRGPVFTNVLLADEINRATPKTQSALLEAMQERSVTVAGTTYQLQEPYMVLATQNPVEQEGTYPLPEAQLDRFLFKMKVFFPTLDEMMEILNRTTTGFNDAPEPVLSSSEILLLKKLVREVPVAPHIQEHALHLVLGSHPNSEYSTENVRKFVRYGASPRGAQALVLAAKVRALFEGRFHVAAEDIDFIARPALRHRILLGFEGQAEGIDTDDLVDELVDKHALVAS